MIYLCEGSVAKHNGAFLVWLFVFQLILRDKRSEGTRPSDKVGGGDEGGHPDPEVGGGDPVSKFFFRPFGLHFSLK